MIPPLIVEEAVDKKIEILAITDHNATGNVRAVIKAAERYPLTIIPGAEIQTREEIHFVCLFNNLLEMDEFQSFIDLHLPETRNNPEFFGEQLIVDHTGNFIAKEDRLLLNSLDISMQALHERVAKIGGMVIPAHVDRKMAGLLANLVFLPEDIDFEILEVSSNTRIRDARSKFPGIKSMPVIQSGDAHQLNDILGLNIFTLDHPSLKEIRKAIKAIPGYRLAIDIPQSQM